MDEQQRSVLLDPVLMARVWGRVDFDLNRPDVCWLWTGAASTQGYGQIKLPAGSGQRRAAVHRLVLQEAVGPPAAGQECRHLCGERLCCNPAHLAWGTRAENEADKVRLGRSNRGRPGQAKLTAQAARDIYRRRSEGAVVRDLAFEYRISVQAIADIMARRSWAWATEEFV